MKLTKRPTTATERALNRQVQLNRVREKGVLADPDAPQSALTLEKMTATYQSTPLCSGKSRSWVIHSRSYSGVTREAGIRKESLALRKSGQCIEHQVAR